MKKEKFIKITIFLIFIAIIILNAWLCDDAYISFRVVKNFINGYGLRWNTFERVQVFTNPLMVLSLIPLYAITHEIYYTSIIFNIVTSIIAVYILLFKISKNNWISILIISLLMISKSFISFTTSGLENSITFLLLAIFYYLFFNKEEYGRKDILLLSFISSLILLNRIDSILLVIPSLIYIFIKREKEISIFKFIFIFLIGMIPFILWELFSLIYYGFLFPNTYYAKLNTGISKKDYIVNGINYMTTNFLLDPITILVISFGSLLTFIKTSKKELCLIIGIITSIIYIIFVGGDFMLGRFLTPALFVTAIGITKLKLNFFKSKTFIIAISIAILAYLVSIINFEKNLSKVDSFAINGVADERNFYFNVSSLRLVGSEKILSQLKCIEYDKYGDNVNVIGNIGFQGYFSDNIIIDFYALSDPFLARIPLKYPRLERIGHIERYIPPGYIESVMTGKNVIEDENLRKYYDVIKVITQDKIFSKKRIKTIIKYHLGKYDYLIDNYLKS